MGARAQGEIFLFAGFQLDSRGLRRRDDLGALSPVPIGGRAVDLLSVLVERHGEVLSKAEIMAPVWPNMAVEDGNLTLQMAALRRILDRGRREGSCIQTVARRGYRFAAEVTRAEAARHKLEANSRAGAARRRRVCRLSYCRSPISPAIPRRGISPMRSPTI